MKTIFAGSAALALMLVGTAWAAQQSAAPAQTLSNNGATSDKSSQASPTFADSKVRIVRLSQVKGTVWLDRNAGHGFEAALPNLPVVEGAKLQTESGFAEVEFEDNSSLRIAPDTLIEFPQLELRPSGAKVSTVNVLKGTVYVSMASTKGNEFTLTFGPDKLNLVPSSHIRLQMEPAEAKLAVLDGTVQVDEPSGPAEVGKKKTLTFDLASQAQPTLAKNVAENENDAWDHDAVEYQKRYANSSAFGNSPYAYGISDMNYYGSFMDAGGCGSMWRPYFASAAWDPFSNGAWAWYSGAGYSWVSPYPWGWMPYHYGGWGFCSGIGWGWRPGGSWLGLTNLRTLPTRPGRPIPPSQPPLRGQSSLVVVNSRPLAVSTLSKGDSFVFRNDSAGLGIPRGSLGKLNKFSDGAERHGSVATPVYSEPLQTGRTMAGERTMTGERTVNGERNSSLRVGSPARSESGAGRSESGGYSHASSGAPSNSGASGGSAAGHSGGGGGGAGRGR